MVLDRRTAVRVLVSLTLLLPAALPGCAWDGSGGIGRQTAGGDSWEASPPAAPAMQDVQEVNLAAIEEFLERTREYGSARPAPPTPDKAPKPQPASVQSAPARDNAATRPEQVATERPVLANSQMTLPEPGADAPAPALPIVTSMRIVSPAASKPLGEQHTPPKSQAANTALEAAPSARAPSLEQVVAHLEEQAEDSSDLGAIWRLRLVQLAMGRISEAMRPDPKLSEGSNALLGSLMETAVAVQGVLRDPASTGEAALTAARRLRQQLAERADPIVSAVALCRRVITFGVYEEMGPAEFVAGRTIQTIVYTEIENLRAEVTSEGRFETRLASRLELLTPEGESVWHTEEPEIVDRCRRRRNDFFIAQRIALPATLPAGEYVLKVFVEDKHSGRVDEAIHPVMIHSALSVANK